MLMIEIVGLVSSVIGILTFIWGIAKFAARETEYKRIRKLIDEHYKTWKELGYILRGGAIVEKETVKRINKFRSKLKNIDDGQKSFLFRIAIQNGMIGEWGKWLLMNKHNSEIVEPLVKCLNGEEGWRPRWRSAYVLEKTFEKDINKVLGQLNSNLNKNDQTQLALHVINTDGVERYLKDISQDKQEERHKHAQALLQEIGAFSKQIEEYKKEQTLKNFWLNKRNEGQQLNY